MTEEREFLVTFEDRGTYGLITLNRPEKRNAMNRAAREALREILSQTTSFGVLVITGVGKSFCAGVDLKESREDRAADPGSAGGGAEWFVVQKEIRQHPAVFIAAVNGFALGGGLTLVNTCELAFASDQAQFGMPEITFGAFAALAGPSTISRIAPKRSAEMIFTGRTVDAAEALAWGLVNDVVPHADLLPITSEKAQQMGALDPLALRAAKVGYHQTMGLEWSHGIEYGLRLGDALRQGLTSVDVEGS